MSMEPMRHVTDDLPAYALGALDEAEREAVAAHLETCDQCARDLAQFEEALYEAAAVGAVRAEPPRDLRTRIVLRHRSAGVTRDPDWGARVRAWLSNPVPLALPLALAVLLVGSFVAGRTAPRPGQSDALPPSRSCDGRGGTPAPPKKA